MWETWIWGTQRLRWINCSPGNRLGETKLHSLIEQRRTVLNQHFVFNPLNFPWSRWMSLSNLCVYRHRENILLSVSGNRKLFTKNGTTPSTQTTVTSSNNSPKSYSYGDSSAWSETWQICFLASPCSLNPCQSLLLHILLFPFLLSYLSVVLTFIGISFWLMEKLLRRSKIFSSLWFLGKIQF